MTISEGPTNLTEQATLMCTTLLQPHNHQFMELIILSFIISILLIKTWSGFLSVNLSLTIQLLLLQAKGELFVDQPPTQQISKLNPCFDKFL